MKQYRIPYEILMYYSINAIVRKTSGFNFETFIEGINANKTRSNNLFSYDVDNYPYFETEDDINVFNLGVKFGHGNSVTIDLNLPSMFQLSSNYINESGDYIKFNNNVISISDGENMTQNSNQLVINVSDLKYISKLNGKIYKSDNTLKSNILSQNGIFNVSHLSNNYLELYRIFETEYEQLSNNQLTTNVEFYSLADILPMYRTTTNSIQDIHNLIVHNYFLWGYYTGLNQKIKAELLTQNIFNHDFYAEDEHGNIIPKYDTTLYTSNINFNNFLIYKFQQTNYLIAKYKHEVELLEKYFLMGVTDAMLGKTNLLHLKHSDVSINLYKRITTTDITSSTFLWEILALYNFNHEYIPYFKQQVFNDNNILPDSNLINEITESTSNIEHFGIYFNNDTDLSGIFDIRHHFKLYGSEFTSSITKNKFEYGYYNDDTTHELYYFKSNNQLDDVSSDCDFIPFIDLENQIKLCAFSRITDKNTWKTTISNHPNITQLVIDLFVSPNGYIDYIESQSNLTYTFNNALLLWNIIEDYIFQLNAYGSISIIPIDKYNVINLFNGYIYNVTDDFPIQFDKSETFLVTLRDYFKHQTENDIVYYMSHRILSGIKSLITSEIPNLTDTLQYCVLKLQSDNTNQMIMVTPDSISNLVSQIIVPE
jgi:hypothetical protein